MTKQTKAYIALVFICIVWGTTYFAIRVGVAHYPAFLFAAIRQIAAGAILIPVALMANRQVDLSKQNILRQMLMGFLMLTFGNGGVTWAEQYVSSGVAALLCSMMPVFAVVFNLLSSKRDRFNAVIGFGMLLGVFGVGLIFRHNLADLAKPGYMAGIVCVVVATAAWALGSSLNKSYGKTVNPLFNSGLQLTFGGVFLTVISVFSDNYTGMEVWNKDGLLALVYLIVFGSVLSYAAYMYVLNVLPVGVATIYAYVNPLIAVVAGALFLNEELNMFIGMAFVTIVASVFLVNHGYRLQHKADKVMKDSKMAEAFPESLPADS
jgi:drug/metabolite transporter (DMT)-like permease